MHPSGEQVEFRSGDQRAVVVQQGGGIRTYDVAGSAVLDGYPVEEMVSGGRGLVLAPWPNRLHTGRYEWDGQEHALPVDEPAKGNAMHGLARWRSWHVVEVEDDAVTMGLRLLPMRGYPFALDLAVRYALGDDGLSVATTATNVGGTPAPYGCGAHPFLTVGTPTVDDAVLLLPASTRLPTDENQIPTGRERVDGTPFDFRSARPVGDVVVDHCFTDLQRGPDGNAEVVLSTADGSRRVVLWLDAGYPYVQLFTGDSLPQVERRRQGLAVEPTSCPPDAFRTGEGLLRLEPGTSVTHRWGIRPR